MNEKALSTLEFNKIIEKLSSKAVSQMGKEVCSALKPYGDLYDIGSAQGETTEAVSCILRKSSLPLGGIRDIRDALKRAEIGGTLSITELMHVGEFLYVCRKVISYSKAENKNEAYTILDELFSVIQPLTLEYEITRIIINELEIADDASPELRDIRRGIKVSNDRIKEQLNSIIHSQSYKNMLQDSVITIRNDRYCVPVKQEYRGTFSGMVHDQSSTGATVFMEPIAVVQLNNRIKELKAAEKNEIERILRDLSLKVAEQADILNANIDVLTRLDFIFAKAELSLSMNGTEPTFNSNGYINIKKGRHPLLDPKTVVPTDIYLGGDFSTLLITGPNTGGKTVALKTIGLFTLMGQAGLHIAANDHSELAVFDEVFADIGDEQSIEQSLSTFSSHMKNIVAILERVTPDSLVLLDELGAGTDPTEGAALGISILQYLHGFKIRTVVTTHYSELKMYALSTDGVENGSCEFNVETLRPTYRLLIGIPGKSNAFAISRRLGLPDIIIDGAKEILSHEDQRFEDIITELEINKKTMLMEKERAEAYRRDAEALKGEYEKQKLRLAEQREKIINEAREEARRVLYAAKSETDDLVKELNKQIRESASQKDIDATRQKLKDKITTAEEGMSQKIRPAHKPPTELRLGDGVFIHSLNQRGVVASPPDKNGDAMINAGIMKIKINISDLSLDDSEGGAGASGKKNISYGRNVKAVKSMNIKTEIDLRGHLVDEAIEKADKYLDDAYLAGLKEVTIIHGKGTGALRAAITNHIKRHPHVESFRLGKFGEGENGVTVVELK